MNSKNDLIYFDKKHPLLANIKSYIIHQCEDVCRNEIDATVITNAFSTFDFGYVRKSLRALTGIRNYNKKLKETIHSFVIAKYNYEDENGIPSIYIQVLCNSKNNSKNNKDGSLILKIIEEKAKAEKIKYIVLAALGEINLKKWYEKNGFKVTTETMIPGSKKIKVYNMVKNLH